MVLYTDGDDKPHLTFPFLNLKQTSAEDKEILNFKIYQDTFEIIRKFQEIFFKTVHSLQQHAISLRDVVFKMKSIEHDCQFSEGLALIRLIPNVNVMEDTGQIMNEIFSHSSFFNYHMLEQIIDQVGAENDKENFIKYKEQFHEYAERDLSICPSQIGKMREEYYANLFVTLNKVHEQCTLNNLHCFCDNLREILNIADVELNLCFIFATRTVGLMFQIPLQTQKTAFPLTQYQCEAITKLGVLQISCGNDCIDHNEDKVLHDVTLHTIFFMCQRRLLPSA